MLKEKQLFGTVDKVDMAIKRLKEFEPPEGYYLAFSGGKDSIVLHHLAVCSGVKFDAHMHLTTVDPPELIYYVREHYPDVPLERAPETMWKLIVRKRMPPTRLVRYCCEVLKERGGAGRSILTGIRWAESSKRSKRRMVETCFKDETKIFVNPIIDWTDGDVWEYIHTHKMPYCKLYDEGFSRIGCIGCPMARSFQLIEFERYPKYKALYLRAFDKMLAGRVEAGLETERWKTGQDVYDWWVDPGRTAKEDPDQKVMFE